MLGADPLLRRPEGPRGASRRPLKPLRRKPKQLEETPTLFAATLGSQGGLVLSGTGGGARRNPAIQGSAAPAETDEAGLLLEAPAGPHVVEPEVLAQAREIAAQLSLPRPKRAALNRRDVGGYLETRPYRGGSDDIDLDRTLSVLAERPFPLADDILVREPTRRRSPVVLLVDVSGSMRGERVRTAAATVGAVAAQVSHDELVVLSFWSDAAKLHRFGQEVSPNQLLELLLRLPAEGLTNIAFPLELAAGELASVLAGTGRVLLLSDCLHNAGPDPRPLAARLPRLDVLLDVSGQHDIELARDLARAGRGRIISVRTHRDVAPGLQEVLA